MIFRRRRTRIEIEQTTLRVAATDLASSAVPPTAEAVHALVLPLLATQPTETKAKASMKTFHAHPAKETGP